MTKKRITMMLFIASVTLGSLLAVGCEDNTGPTVPTVQYRAQNFFMAISDGHQVVGNHNQSSAVTINWNGAAGTNSPLPVHVPLVPHSDGIVDSHDNGAWDYATEVDIPLTPVSSDRDSGITNAKMKVVFNFATPATAYFLIRWQDSSKDIWKHAWQLAPNPLFPDYDPNPYMPARVFGAPDYEEDWVGFMWDVWKKYESGTGPVYFEKQTANFQTQGCAIACHDPAPTGFNPMSFMDDSEGRTYTDPLTGLTVNASPILDVWFWGAGRTNCGDDPAKTVATREPSWIVDAQITPGGVTFQTSFGIRRDDDTLGTDSSKQQFEVDYNLPPPYAFNADASILGGVGKERADDPNSGQPYIWSSTAKLFSLSGWLLNELCGGWINNPGLSKAGNVQAQGVWADGWWTLELEHQIDDGDANDSIIGTYDSH